MKCNNCGYTPLNLCYTKHVEVYTRFDGDSDGFFGYVWVCPKCGNLQVNVKEE